MSKAVDRLLSRVARHNPPGLLAILCCVVGLVAVFVIRDIRSANGDVNAIYTGSVHGLLRLGRLQYDAQETRRLTLYALSTSDSNLQVQYADQSRAADQRVKDQIEEYASRAIDSSEAALASRLRRDWNSYLTVRDDVVALILEGSVGEAIDLDLSHGVPAFDVVRRDLDDVMALYDRQASARLASVVASSRRSSLRLVSILGFTLLLAAAGIWAIQRGRMLSTLELARLQMEFVASVSHELRTPLTVLRSASDNLVDQVVRDPSEIRRYGLVLQNQSRRMSQLVDEILLFASTEDRKHPYVLRPVPVSEILQTVLARTELLIRQAGFVLEKQIEPDLPPVVGDLSAICQCLNNLIENAIKYAREPRNGVVRMTIAARIAATPPELQLSVIDYGPGIERSELTRIFEPFYRSPSVVNAQIHGTGLGLALARRIAEAIGGSLTVVSEVSVGSTFTLHLPVLQPGSAQEDAPASQENAQGVV
jgi:signal transduction histidine kinase